MSTDESVADFGLKAAASLEKDLQVMSCLPEETMKELQVLWRYSSAMACL